MISIPASMSGPLKMIGFLL